VAIAGAAKAVEPATDNASRTKRGIMRCMVSPPLFRWPKLSCLGRPFQPNAWLLANPR
jgi:hypothetical protein